MLEWSSGLRLTNMHCYLSGCLSALYPAQSMALFCLVLFHEVRRNTDQGRREQTSRQLRSNEKDFGVNLHMKALHSIIRSGGLCPLDR